MKTLTERIKMAERISLRLEPPPALRQQYNDAALGYVDRFLDTIDRVKAYQAPQESLRRIDDEPIGEEGEGIGEILEFIEGTVDAAGINPASGGHLGYIPGGGIYPSALGDLLADVMNRYAGIWFGGPGAVKLENKLVRWMCGLLGYPESALGNLTSGGSIANLIAIVTAREAHGLEPEDIRTSVIYLTEQVHHSIQKAIRIAGLGHAPVRYIGMDERFRMRADLLEQQVRDDVDAGLHPFMLVGTVGTTDTGAIDPVGRQADISEKYGLWYHIDAAYGGFFVLSSLVGDAFVDVGRSDSLTIDPHKGLFLPYGTGAVLIKDLEASQKGHMYTAPYMQDANEAWTEPSPANLSPELTKHFRGLRMWLPLKLFGLRPFRAALDEKILLCRYFYDEVRKLGFEVGPYPELSVCIYRYVPDRDDSNEFNKRLVQHIHRDGRVFLSSTTLDGVVWLRLAVLCFRTHLATIDLALQMLEECLARTIAERD